MKRPCIEGCIMSAVEDSTYRASDLREIARYTLSLEAALKEAEEALKPFADELLCHHNWEKLPPAHGAFYAAKPGSWEGPQILDVGHFRSAKTALASIAKLKE